MTPKLVPKNDGIFGVAPLGAPLVTQAAFGRHPGWQHLGSSVASGVIWQHLGAPGSIWKHLAALGSIWAGSIRQHLAASGILQQHLAALGIIWQHLTPSGFARRAIRALEPGNQEKSLIFVTLSTKVRFFKNVSKTGGYK